MRWASGSVMTRRSPSTTQRGTKVGPHPSRWWNKLFKSWVVWDQTEQLHPPFGSLQDPGLFGVDIKHHIIRIVELSARFPEFVGVFAVQPLRASPSPVKACKRWLRRSRTTGRSVKVMAMGSSKNPGTRRGHRCWLRLPRPPLHLHHSIIAGVGDQEITLGVKRTSVGCSKSPRIKRCSEKYPGHRDA